MVNECLFKNNVVCGMQTHTHTHTHTQLQYEAMGLCDSYEEEMPPLRKPPEHLFDDPKYLSREEAQVSQYVLTYLLLYLT